jgi:hypothetical protein
VVKVPKQTKAKKAAPFERLVIRQNGVAAIARRETTIDC